MSLMFKNNATSRLKVNTDAASLTLTLYDGEGARFPQPVTVDDYFTVTIEDRRTFQVEVCRCTARAGDILTVERAQEGTAAQSFIAGAIVSNRFTAGTLQQILDLQSYSKPEADTRFVNTAGDTMTGALIVLAPTAGGHATTKTYVDGRTPITVDAPNDGLLYGRQSLGWVRALPFASYTAADILTKIKTVDGAGSGLDADLLDGNSSAFFAQQTALDNTDANVTNVTGRVTTLETTMLTKAPTASPVFTGDPRAPTPSIGDNDTSIATTAFVQTVAAGKIGDAPNDGQYYQRRNNAWEVGPGGLVDAPVDGTTYGRKDGLWSAAAPLASPALTGVPTAPTAAQATNTTQIATTAFVQTKVAGYLPLTGGSLSGSLTLTAGTITVSAGSVNVTAGNINLGGNLTVSNGGFLFVNNTASGNAILYLDKAQGAFSAQIVARRMNKNRWVLLLGNTTAEDDLDTGTDNGSDLQLLRYNDAGGPLGTALIITRSSGAATYTGSWTVAGALTVSTTDPVNFTTSAVTCGALTASGTITAPSAQINGNINGATITATGSMVANTHFISSGAAVAVSSSGGGSGAVYLRPQGWNVTTGQLAVTAAGAVTIASTLTVQAGGLTVSAGGAAITGAVTVSAALTVSGLLTFATNMASSTATVIIGTTGAGNIYLRPNGYSSGTGQVVVGSGGDISLVADASINCAGTAGWVQCGGGIRSKAGQVGSYSSNYINIEYRAGTGSFLWVNSASQGQFAFTSDYRIKKDIEPLPSMWDVVKRMRPVKYTNATWADFPEMYIASDDERWSFIAHELQEDLLPTASSGYKDEPNQLQTPNPLTIMAALCKALQEAMARIEALEGGAA